MDFFSIFSGVMVIALFGGGILAYTFIYPKQALATLVFIITLGVIAFFSFKSNPPTETQLKLIYDNFSTIAFIATIMAVTLGFINSYKSAKERQKVKSL